MPDIIRSSHEDAPISAPPAAAASVPRLDTPPEAPAGSILPVRTDRGGFLLSVPISVAHVSEVTVAITPINKNSQCSIGTIAFNRTKTIPSPPLAKTCPASRRPVLA
ncbi:hypothetical protein D3C76_1287180 [compost metagenome]